MDHHLAPAETVPGPQRATSGPVRLDGRGALTPAQSAVLAVVEEECGCSIRYVALRLRTSHATASYHLFCLARLGFLVQVRDGREVRHFPGNAAPDSAAYIAALLRDARKAKVLRLLATESSDRLTIHQMARLTGLTFAVLKRTLQQLAWGRIVVLERRRYRYTVRVEPQARATLQAACAEPEPRAEALA